MLRGEEPVDGRVVSGGHLVVEVGNYRRLLITVFSFFIKHHHNVFSLNIRTVLRWCSLADYPTDFGAEGRRSIPGHRGNLPP